VHSKAAFPLFVGLVVAACGAGGSGGSGAPIELSVPKGELPSPGLGCDGIEWTAPLGSRVLYRPDDGRREVHVKYMSRATHGLVTGIDAFSIDTLRLIRVIMPYNGGE
jgi:hypothetical protein